MPNCFFFSSPVNGCTMSNLWCALDMTYWFLIIRIIIIIMCKCLPGASCVSAITWLGNSNDMQNNKQVCTKQQMSLNHTEARKGSAQSEGSGWWEALSEAMTFAQWTKGSKEHSNVKSLKWRLLECSKAVAGQATLGHTRMEKIGSWEEDIRSQRTLPRKKLRHFFLLSGKREMFWRETWNNWVTAIEELRGESGL